MEREIINNKPRESLILKKIFKDTMIVQTVSAVMSVAGIVVDGAVTGSFLGSAEFAAYGLTTPLLLTVTALSNAAGTGVSTLLGKDIGKGDIKSAEKHLFSSVTAVTGIFVLFAMLVFLAARPISCLLGADAGMTDLTVQYLRGYAPSIPPLILFLDQIRDKIRRHGHECCLNHSSDR
jgi:Na+-driven multidrug efflux pump